MQTPTWRLGNNELRAWLGRLLAEDKRVLAPVTRDGLTLFAVVSSAEEVDLGSGKTRWSPKEFLFPRSESLYTYELGAAEPELRDPPLAQQEQVLVGVRSCDAAGLARLDAVFLRGGVEDPLYARRRALTTVVAFACKETEPECFCTAVGGSPMDTEGVDMLVVPFGDLWLMRPVTDKGRALVSEEWTTASPADWSLAAEEVQRAAKQIARSPLPENLAEALERRFDSPVWEEVARRCLSCSICAYVCPSCSCFDVHHEGNAWGGREFRCWDACTFALFTHHASGHNPRQASGTRYRQRLLHKFAYLTPDDDELIRCVGCGRCITHCPVGIDIHDAALQVVSSAEEARQMADASAAMVNPYRPHLLRIAAMRDETPDVRTLTLRFVDQDEAAGLPGWQPGQFGEYTVFGAGECVFALAGLDRRRQGSAPAIECTYRAIGKVTRALRGLGEGQVIGFRGPYGNSFPLEQWRGKDLVFLGGGIGMAALRAALLAVLERRSEFGRLLVLNGARSVADMVYKAEMPGWEEIEGVEVVRTVDPGGETADWDGEVGLIPDVFERQGLAPDGRIVVACGPPIMLHFLFLTLEKLGYSPEQVITTLENKMKCGLGQCGRCNVGSFYVCRDGPVVSWETMQALPADL